MSLTEVFDKYSNFETNLYGMIRDYENGEPRQNYNKVICHLNFLIADQQQYENKYENKDFDLDMYKKAHIARNLYFNICHGHNLTTMLSFTLEKLKIYIDISEEKENKMLKAIRDNDIYSFYEEYDSHDYFIIAGW